MRPTLSWGHRLLMCPPDHFDVAYEINPWMDRRVGVDRDVARHQWGHLVDVVRQAGAEVELMDPSPGLPDLVFTANAGLVSRNRVIVSRFHDPERQGETPHDAAWFSARGFDVRWLPGDLVQEGAGDALPFSARPEAATMLFAGHGIRSDRGASGALARALDVTVEPLHLVDPRLYHLDLALCPLGPGRAMFAPAAFSAPSRRRLEQLIAHPIVLDLDEALTFCANSVVIGSTVVMPACPARVGRELEAGGFDVVVTPVSEFQKAGGAVRCLSLALDVELASRASALAA